MRKIEEQMLNAVNNKINFTKDNTSVSYDKVCNASSVLLHGHSIYRQWHGTDKQIFSLCGWNTPTTRSRLRVLGVSVCQRKGNAYFLFNNGTEYKIDVKAMYYLENNTLKKYELN